MEACGKCISCEVEAAPVRLTECCWFITLWLRPRFETLHYVLFGTRVRINLVHNGERGTGKEGSISMLQNALLCQNALLSLSRVRARATSVFVFNFTFCQLSKVLTRI